MDVWIVVLALTVLILAASLVARRPDRRGLPHHEAIIEGEGTNEVEPEGEVVLVALPEEANAVLVLGSADVVADLDQAGLGRDAADYRQPLLPQVIKRVMSLGESPQARAEKQNQLLAQEVAQGRIVRLSDVTMQHLSEGEPVLSKSGELLAQVRGDSGKLSHVMRFSKQGPEAIVAANAATLAVTAAVSQQLEAIEERLEEISQTLEGLVADVDRARLADVLTGGEILLRVGEEVRQRGTMDEDDYNRVVSAEYQVRRQLKEADLKLGETVDPIPPDLNRKERLVALEDLVGKERLEYWLAIVVKAELAQTRWDLLHLFYEASKHPAHSARLTEETRAELLARRRRLELIGERLQALADPEARTPLDPVRQLSRHRLAGLQTGVDELLSRHGNVFLPPPDQRVDEGLLPPDRRAVIDSGFKRLVEPPAAAK